MQLWVSIRQVAPPRKSAYFCPRSGRFVCGNSAFSQQISTFYGPSVQAMETRLGARQRRRPPTVHRGRTRAPRLQRPVASEDEASACSELRLGYHPETPVIEPCRETITEVNVRRDHKEEHEE